MPGHPAFNETFWCWQEISIQYGGNHYAHFGIERKPPSKGQYETDGGCDSAAYPRKLRNLKKVAMILSSGDPAMYDGAMFSYKGDFVEYLDLEDMGVFTAYGMENGSASKLKELRDFGRNLK